LTRACYGTPLAPSLCRQGRGRAAEGCNPAVATQAVECGEDQAGGAHDAAREAAECDPLEHAPVWRAAAGISYSSVQRIWHAHGLKPHLTKTFKVSRDKNFAAKVEDVVGLYLNPPDKALVLCVDEKSQIQALDRTQPGLPMKKGRAAP